MVKAPHPKHDGNDEGDALPDDEGAEVKCSGCWKVVGEARLVGAGFGVYSEKDESLRKPQERVESPKGGKKNVLYSKAGGLRKNEPDD